MLTVSVRLQLAGIGPLGYFSSGHCSHPCPVDIVDVVKIQLACPGGAGAVPPAGICLGPALGSAHKQNAGISPFWQLPSQKRRLPSHCHPVRMGSVGEHRYWPTASWAALGRATPARQVPSHWHWWDGTWRAVPWPVLSTTRKYPLILENAKKMTKGLRHLWYEGG